eukprot:940971-Pyramimonas_sp.AAC.1
MASATFLFIGCSDRSRESRSHVLTDMCVDMYWHELTWVLSVVACDEIYGDNGGIPGWGAVMRAG